ncbi:DsbA family protein [Serratia rubidaea]|uniref:DsbA family protein n=1 Tax=Serratia rubidaea TaxID=61652 RepID=UPI001F324433|nr:DsbA family protein [Serratia rubidaea]MDC6109521.1 DsbA family protein [Serratia rubidaea]UJD81598.1 thiol:disulfide interchange protein [Serratia rubidaea]UJD86161.1 thiol:disulfide interchange protein [Serratia rubidaea]
MFKKPLALIVYTLFIIVISSLITTAYIHYFVLDGQHEDIPALTSIGDEQIKNSPIKEDNTIVEIFSYGCHYCAINEGNVKNLESQLPSGSKLVRLHIGNPQNSGLSAYAPLFATLSVMGLEEKYRESAYQAIIKERQDLSDPAQLGQWLQDNGIDRTDYRSASQSQDVKDLLAYMTAVSEYYQVNATPSFIVNKKWLAQQDSDFPTFSKKLLSLLKNDSPQEP